MKYFIVLIICFLKLNSLFGQNLINGDLEGSVSGYSTLPPFWTSISSSDVNCMATLNGTSPDLINTTQPDAYNGVIGTPYSGNTFAGGNLGSDPVGVFFHEGIKQHITGFTIGVSYTIKFFQSNIKTRYCVDTSGRWMVILDNTVIGISAASISQLPFNSLSNVWDMRTASFTANQSSYDLKFLPADDDTNYTASISDLGGCLYMGIDSISISQDLSSGFGIIENDFGNKLLLYPNPTDGDFSINLGDKYECITITIRDLNGNLIRSEDYSQSQILNLELYEAPGTYLLNVTSNNKKALIKLFKK